MSEEQGLDLRPWTDVACKRSGVIVSFHHDLKLQPAGAVDVEIDVPQDPPTVTAPGSKTERRVAEFKIQIVQDDREMARRKPLSLRDLLGSTADEFATKIVERIFAGIESSDGMSRSLTNKQIARLDVMGVDVSKCTTPSEPQEFEFSCSRQDGGRPFKLVLRQNSRAFGVRVTNAEGQEVLGFVAWLLEDFSMPDIFQYDVEGAVRIVTHHQV